MAQNYYLMHHGIKGMKWGVRRTPEQLGHRTRGSMSDRQVYNTARKVYRLDAKNYSGRGSDRSKRKQMELEEKLEGHLASHPSDSKKNREILDRARDKEANRKLNDPEFQRKAAKAAKIALAVGAMYAGHKVLNNPEAIKAGKQALSAVLGAKGTVKASAIKAITNSSEFKIAKAAGKAGLEGGKKALKFVGSDNFRKTASGIGAVASTAGVLRKQIKDLKNKPEGDTVDKALGYAKKASDIGKTANSLAKGDAVSPTSNNSTGSSKTDASGRPKTEFTDKGGQSKYYANRHLDREDLNQLRQYKVNHPGMTTKEALDELGWLDKETTTMHSAIRTGWSFNPMAGCRYIF